jgi:5'-nucleotidase
VFSSCRARRRVTGTAAFALLSTPLAVVSLTAAPAHAAPVDITIVGTNDFHGRLLPGFDIPGAAEYAGAVASIRADNPNTIFAAAGDLIGATTFESFINQDKPTIDVLNAMGLDVSAVGNHELDKGYDDLVNRVMAPYDAGTNPKGGAEWEYIAANIDEPGDAAEIAPSWTVPMGGVTVGFVGAVTEALPSLVSPSGIDGLTVTDIVDATNAAADDLEAAGADVIVLLVHEGAPSTNCEAMDDDPTSAFGSIVTGVDANVDAIISGHTHLPYNCTLPVAGGGSRPVVSAGQYGSHLNRLDFTVDDASGDISGFNQTILDLNSETYPADAGVQAIVDQAKADAEGPGSVELGEIAAAFNRARRVEDGAYGENRGGESTIGNTVAEVQRWATSAPAQGGAEIAFMNPGGLREDINDTDSDGFPEPVTYKEAAVVQPFANTLVNMTMTGDQIRALLEQQWQPAGSSRPFLRLGVSDGFKYDYDPEAGEGEHIGRMWLHGKRIGRTDIFSVTANSFLADGGDNFTVFEEASDKADTGKIDLEAMVDYMAEFAATEPLAPDYAQRAVGVHFPDGRVVNPNHTLTVDLSSLAMTGAGDQQDGEVLVRMDGEAVGSFPVDNSIGTGRYEEVGRAQVEVPVPPRTAPGRHRLRVTGDTTGTTLRIPFRVTRRPTELGVALRPDRISAGRERARVVVTVGSEIGTPRGRVVLKVSDKSRRIARLKDGRAVFRLGRFERAGLKALSVRYAGTKRYVGDRDLSTFRVTRR